MKLISVLMSAYNSERYVAEAIKSILSQDYPDFELICVEDGSTDRTWDIIQSIPDSRIRKIRNDTNLGIARSLNKGLEYCKGEYVAKMDSDDVARPERLRIQLQYLDEHADCVCLGSWYGIVGAKDIVETPLSDEDIKVRLFESSPIAHPTAIMKADILKKVGYDTDFKYALDYKLWSDLSTHGHLANIPVPLIDYRRHDAQISRAHFDMQSEFADRVRLEQLARLGIPDWQSNARRHLGFIHGTDTEHLTQTLEWASLILSANRKSQSFPEPRFTDLILNLVVRITGAERYSSIVRIIAQRMRKRLAKFKTRG